MNQMFQPADEAIPTSDWPMAGRSWRRVYALVAFFIVVANLRPARASDPCWRRSPTSGFRALRPDFALIGMRANDHRRAASLSTMSQAAAYLIAAAGPVAFGWLHDLSTGWTTPMLSSLAIALLQAVAGFCAGRAGQI
jgi:hypothetical protein